LSANTLGSVASGFLESGDGDRGRKGKRKAEKVPCMGIQGVTGTKVKKREDGSSHCTTR